MPSDNGTLRGVRRVIAVQVQAINGPFSSPVK
jgi:hypothetical protein